MVSVKLELSDNSLNELLQAMSILNEKTMPNTAAAVGNALGYSQSVIQDYLHNMGKLDGVPNLDKPIKKVITNVQKNGEFNYTISASGNGLKEAQEGRQEYGYFDMKTKYPYGKKSRVSKKGIPFLIIPFRWGTPNGHNSKRRWNSFIPQAQYNTVVKGMKMSSVYTTTHGEKNFAGDVIQRAEYQWKSRITKENAWNDYSIGMVRMKDVTGSTYFTFRIISAVSPANSWIRHYDARPAIDIESAWARTVENNISRMIEEGLKADLT